ncbi:T7SS effector LXG polymorphic toxin [Peribacillus kribbensis]|uniref:T7SS effector LXG polymorphic toxin n=1 Tax=Peribacillus kribbensis TaxID=356658 RepID=UPI00040A0EC8|nr:LXG domain-containing protein [Peribacillus kribbensis]
MKAIDVSEIFSSIDQSLQQKKKEKEHILDIRDAVNKVIDLGDALEGSGGNAIKDHFTTVHIPAILLLNQFQQTYMDELKKVKELISDYETQSGLVREDFIEHDVKQGLKKLENVTRSIAESINNELTKVSDLVNSAPLNLSRMESLLNRADTHNQKTVEDLHKLDSDASKSLKEVKSSLDDVGQFLAKIEGWSKDGVFLSKKTINEIDSYLEKNDSIAKLIDSALELSIEQGDSTFLGMVTDWLDKIGKTTGGRDALKGTAAAAILLTKRLEFIKDGAGNFNIRATDGWKQIRGKYADPLAAALYKIIKKGSGNPIPFIRNYFSKYQNAPSRMLRDLVGLSPNANTQSLREILKKNFPNLKFVEEGVENYKRFPLDAGGTLKQFVTVDGLKGVSKKIPYLGVVISVVTNGSEFFNDGNKYKSISEKAGRAVAGIGMDAGVAALTTGGAALGTMICPGPGTLIGGAVGATIGIISSMAFEDTVKDLGEKAGKWTGEKINEVKKTLQKKTQQIQDLAKDAGDALSNAGHFVYGLFR